MTREPADRSLARLPGLSRPALFAQCSELSFYYLFFLTDFGSTEPGAWRPLTRSA